MIMRFSYSQGYDDALLDVMAWFENHSPQRNCRLFSKKVHGLILVILRRLFKDREKFIQEKEYYNFAFSEEEKKLAGIKDYIPEPPRWAVNRDGDGYCLAYCPCCRQEHFFFTLDDVLKTEKCPLCKVNILPPVERKKERVK